jgi:hypothetical protein
MAPRQPAPTVIMSTAAITMPTAEERAKTRGRGGNKTFYNFGALAVGSSIVVIGRTAKQLSSTVSSANKIDAKHFVTDDKGKTVMVAKTNAAGNVIKGADNKPVMVEKLKKFFVVDCDPNTDPEGATARIWREQ